MENEYYYINLLLIRHGQARSPDGQYGPETPLLKLGLRQARLLAQAMQRDKYITTIYSSPIPRAINTALPISKILQIDVTQDSRIAEFQVDSSPLDKIVGTNNDLLI